jgi:hypothetical protein
MSEKDKDTLEQQGEPNEFMPGEDEFDEEPEGEEAAEAAEVETTRGGRKFGLRRGAPEEEEEAHPLGSVRAVHDRVRIDDRASAIYVLIAAIGLIAILIVPVIVSAIPAGPAPTLPPLPLNTYQTPPTMPPATPTPTLAPTGSATAS